MPETTAARALPFSWGTREFARPIASIPFAAGAMAAQQRIMKAGWLGLLAFRLESGAANVTVAGTSGTPSPLNMISSYRLSFNGGFMYRNVDGESMAMIQEVEAFGSNDPVTGSPQFANYNPASATNQTISWIVEDLIAMNLGPNVDKFLLAAHSRNADITLDINFGTTASVVANTETVAFTGTLLIDAIFLLDPDYRAFSLPDLSSVQQWLSDVSFNNVVVGDNTMPITPVQGPQYLQLLFKVLSAANVPDPQGVTPITTRVQLQVNGAEDFIDVPGRLLQFRNFKHYGRKLPAGWYVLDFLDDLSLVNTASTVARNILATDYIAQLNLIVTIAAGTTIGAGALIKTLKRLKVDVKRKAA